MQTESEVARPSVILMTKLMDQQADLKLCNLLARGKTMAQARGILGLVTPSPSPEATVGTAEAPAEARVTGGGEPAATEPEPAAPPAAKPAWMP